MNVFIVIKNINYIINTFLKISKNIDYIIRVRQVNNLFFFRKLQTWVGCMQLTKITIFKLSKLIDGDEPSVVWPHFTLPPPKMATPQLKSVVVNQNHNNNEVKWLNHYSSTHQILTVGDGDFSFSLCLATAFASDSNITATSLDSYGLSLLSLLR